MSTKILALLAVVLVASAAANATVTTLNYTQAANYDTGGWGGTYVPGSGNINQSSPANNWTYWSMLSMVKFDLSTLTGFVGGTVNSAHLNINVDDSHQYAPAMVLYGNLANWGSTQSFTSTTPGAIVTAADGSAPARPYITSIVQAWAGTPGTGAGAVSSANGIGFTTSAAAGGSGQGDMMYGFLSNPGYVTLTVDYTPVPEPATMTLLALGGIGALLRRRRAA